VAKFVDKLGREWVLEITLGDLPALKELGLDVEAVFDDPKAASAAGKVEVLGRALWHLCEEQAGAREVTPEQFARAITGPVRWAAAAALEAAVLDFTLPPAAATKAKARLSADRDRVIETAFPASPGGSAVGVGTRRGRRNRPPPLLPPAAPADGRRAAAGRVGPRRQPDGPADGQAGRPVRADPGAVPARPGGRAGAPARTEEEERLESELGWRLLGRALEQVGTRNGGEMAASAGAIRAGRAFVELGVDQSPLDRALGAPAPASGRSPARTASAR
jgi:hypothetical protein